MFHPNNVFIDPRYRATGRMHGTRNPDRVQPNYTPSLVWRYVWPRPMYFNRKAGNR